MDIMVELTMCTFFAGKKSGGCAVSKILFSFLSILILISAVRVQSSFAKDYIILARRYRSSFGGADRTLRGWQDTFEPKTSIQEEEYQRKQEEGLIPGKKNEYDKYLENQGYYNRKTDNYKRRYRGLELEKEDTEEDIGNGEPVSTEPYNIDPDSYENVNVRELSEEEKATKLKHLKENLEGLSEEDKEDLVRESGIEELYKEDIKKNQEEEYYDVNKYLSGQKE